MNAQSVEGRQAPSEKTLRSWASKNEHRQLSHWLAAAIDREFERRLLPVVRTIWPDMQQTKRMDHLDRRGVDLFVWSDRGPLPIVVQCKGFQEQVVGAKQVNLCITSVRKLLESDLRAVDYLLVHNQHVPDRHQQKRLDNALRELVAAGKVERAQVWSRQLLLRNVFNQMHERVKGNIRNAGREAVAEHVALEAPLCEPLAEVPVQVSNLVVDPYQLVRASAPERFIADPAPHLTGAKRENRTILLGEYGFGKTTAALRALSMADEILYVPASRIVPDTNSTKVLLMLPIAVER